MSIFDIFKKVDEHMEKIDKDMEKGELYMRKGLEADSQKEYYKALVYFNKSIEIADYVFEVYINRGAVYQKLDQFLDARDDYNKAILLAEGNAPIALNNLKVIENWCDFSDKYGEVIKQNIQNDGLEYATKRFAEVITDKMKNNYDDIYYFILEEIKELREYFNNNTTIMFIEQSGIQQSEYLNPNSNGVNQSIQNHAHTFSKSLYCCLSREPSSMLQFRISLIEQIMKQHKIGKYNNGISKKIIVNNDTISEAAHAIAIDCFSEGVSHPRYDEIYNACLDIMYANALYIGYGVSDGVDIDLDDYLDRGVKIHLNTLLGTGQDKNIAKEHLFRYLKEKKFNEMEKNMLRIQ